MSTANPSAALIPLRAKYGCPTILTPCRTVPRRLPDHIMVCQSMVEKIPLISYDEKVNAYFI
jgi:hypothetical protein